MAAWFSSGGAQRSFDKGDGPWSAGASFGKTGQPSGIFNTYPIPFGNVTVTVELRTAPQLFGRAALDGGGGARASAVGLGEGKEVVIVPVAVIVTVTDW